MYYDAAAALHHRWDRSACLTELALEVDYRESAWS